MINQCYFQYRYKKSHAYPQLLNIPFGFSWDRCLFDTYTTLDRSLWLLLCADTRFAARWMWRLFGDFSLSRDRLSSKLFEYQHAAKQPEFKVSSNICSKTAKKVDPKLRKMIQNKIFNKLRKKIFYMKSVFLYCK